MNKTKRLQTIDDVFSRISGTTAISGAVDSSFTLAEERCGSGKAKLSCIGRDIEYRELTLERNGENVWEIVADSKTQGFGGDITPQENSRKIIRKPNEAGCE